MTTSEDRLRHLLTAAVPDAPDSVADPAPVVGRARRARRRVVTTVTGAAAAVAVIASLTAVLLPDDVQPMPAPGGSVAREAPDPFGTDPCPVSLRLDRTRSTPLPTSARSIRLCAFADTGRTQAVPLDALVTRPGAVLATARDLPTAAADRCAAIDVVSPSTALVVTDGEGARHAYPVGYCSDVLVGRRAVASDRVQALILAALGEQRDNLPAPAPASSPWADRLCTADPTPAPVDPMRDAVVAASACLRRPTRGRPALSAYRLTGTRLAQVKMLWANAARGAVTNQSCDSASLDSLDVLTAYGDVVRIRDDGCSEIVGEGDGETYRIDLRLSDLLPDPR